MVFLFIWGEVTLVTKLERLSDPDLGPPVPGSQFFPPLSSPLILRSRARSGVALRNRPCYVSPGCQYLSGSLTGRQTKDGQLETIS